MPESWSEREPTVSKIMSGSRSNRKPTVSKIMPESWSEREPTVSAVGLGGQVKINRKGQDSQGGVVISFSFDFEFV